MTIKKKKPTKSVGRARIKLTPIQIKKVEEMAASMTIGQIADYFGISESTFYEIKNRDSGVFGAYKKGRSKGIEEATGLLWNNIRAGDNTSLLFYLKTQAGWNEKHLLETKDTTQQLASTVFKKSGD